VIYLIIAGSIIFLTFHINALLSRIERTNSCLIYSQCFRDAFIQNIISSGTRNQGDSFNASLTQEMLLNSTNNAINRHDNRESFLIVTEKDLELLADNILPNKQKTIATNPVN
jgi:hypothetical protein